MITVELNDKEVCFLLNGDIRGRYVLSDSFKPYFRSLCTPAGHETTLVSPGDHRHHKGLMFGLRCVDLNFWEENPGEPAGVQRILSTRSLPDGDGIEQELLWVAENGEMETYREVRQIRAEEEGDAICYQWKTRREALRDHRLIKSEWSLEVPDGRTINYHGLGIRLPWMWRFPVDAFCGVEKNGVPEDPMAACGATDPSVGFWGLVDGKWNRTVASVTVRQPPEQAHTWFVLKGDFPYLSVGPSNAEELEVATGHVFEETYWIEVADRPSDFNKN